MTVLRILAPCRRRFADSRHSAFFFCHHCYDLQVSFDSEKNCLVLERLLIVKPCTLTAAWAAFHTRTWNAENRERNIKSQATAKVRRCRSELISTRDVYFINHSRFSCYQISFVRQSRDETRRKWSNFRWRCGKSLVSGARYWRQSRSHMTN